MDSFRHMHSLSDCIFWQPAAISQTFYERLWCFIKYFAFVPGHATFGSTVGPSLNTCDIIWSFQFHRHRFYFPPGTDQARNAVADAGAGFFFYHMLGWISLQKRTSSSSSASSSSNLSALLKGTDMWYLCYPCCAHNAFACLYITVTGSPLPQHHHRHHQSQ